MTGVKTVIYNFSIISMRQVSGWVSQSCPSDSPEAPEDGVQSSQVRFQVCKLCVIRADQFPIKWMMFRLLMFDICDIWQVTCPPPPPSLHLDSNTHDTCDVVTSPRPARRGPGCWKVIWRLTVPAPLVCLFFRILTMCFSYVIRDFSACQPWRVCRKLHQKARERDETSNSFLISPALSC